MDAGSVGHRGHGRCQRREVGVAAVSGRHADRVPAQGTGPVGDRSSQLLPEFAQPACSGRRIGPGDQRHRRHLEAAAVAHRRQVGGRPAADGGPVDQHRGRTPLQFVEHRGIGGGRAGVEYQRPDVPAGLRVAGDGRSACVGARPRQARPVDKAVVAVERLAPDVVIRDRGQRLEGAATQGRAGQVGPVVTGGGLEPGRQTHRLGGRGHPLMVGERPRRVGGPVTHDRAADGTGVPARMVP